MTRAGILEEKQGTCTSIINVRNMFVGCSRNVVPVQIKTHLKGMIRVNLS
jgi:hypothetical protein